MQRSWPLLYAGTNCEKPALDPLPKHAFDVRHAQFFVDAVPVVLHCFFTQPHPRRRFLNREPIPRELHNRELLRREFSTCSCHHDIAFLVALTALSFSRLVYFLSTCTHRSRQSRQDDRHGTLGCPHLQICTLDSRSYRPRLSFSGVGFGSA
mgnify:CR=1 FL=1